MERVQVPCCLIETAKANDCQPYEYLEYVLREIPKLKRGMTMLIFFLGTCQKRNSPSLKKCRSE
ncbi:transposase domain-containing protein [uncultured Vibrio sp.]|uniref:transposase domain-containing protein n=1 Tax=uncultured Vibrio sp. TaxID=114054 RepID=UPI003459C3D5